MSNPVSIFSACTFDPKSGGHRGRGWPAGRPATTFTPWRQVTTTRWRRRQLKRPPEHADRSHPGACPYVSAVRTRSEIELHQAEYAVHELSRTAAALGIVPVG